MYTVRFLDHATWAQKEISFSSIEGAEAFIEAIGEAVVISVVYEF